MPTYWPGSTVYGSFDTHSPTTDALVDADSVAVVVYRNGVLQADVDVALEDQGDGIYGYSFPVPSAWSGGDVVEARRSATIGDHSDIASDFYTLADAPSTGDGWDGFYATDADIAAAIAPADYEKIAPDNQVVAEGEDGVIPAGGFTLTSATNPDFGNRGVIPEMVLIVREGGLLTTDLFAVSAVDGPTLTLRRIGLDDGQGDPPGGTTGQAGVRFTIQTFRRQLEQATEYLSSVPEFSEVLEAYPARAREATVAMVVANAYGQVGDAFPPGTHGGGPWQLKRKQYLAIFAGEISLIRQKKAEIEAEAGVSDPQLPAVGRFVDGDDWIVPRAW